MHNSFILFILIFFVSCSKDKFNKPQEIKEMEIVLTTPTEMQEFPFQSTIPIQGTIQANFFMHGYSIRLTSSFGEVVLFEDFHHVHGNVLEIQSSWLNTLEENTFVNIEIRAVGNHEGTQDLVLNRTIVCLGT